MKKRMISLMLALLMLFSVFPVGVFADADDVQSFVEVNPLYADTISEKDIPRLLYSGEKTTVGEIDKSKYKTSISSVAEDMRKAMLSRDTEFALYYCSDTNKDANTIFSSIKKEALKHTGKSFEGDYLAWVYGGFDGNISKTYSSGMYYYTFDLSTLYYTTAAQEKKVAERIAELYKQFGFNENTSDYTVIKTVYDYICANVTYDYENLNNDSYVLKHTAYAALMNGTAVCQGFAALLYAMLLYAGVDSRIIASADHGWNIARIGKLYYNLDSTWDAGVDPEQYRWFLKCPNSFTNHPRAYEYKTAEFNAAYPMAENDYLYHRWDSGVVFREPTCTAQGIMLYTCTDEGCGETMTIPIPATKHSFGDWTQSKAPTCSRTGLETRTCSKCGATEAQTVAKLPHDFVDGQCTVCGAKEQANFFSSFLSFFREFFAWFRSLFSFSFNTVTAV